MGLNTRITKREPVHTLAEYAIDTATSKSIKLNIPETSIKSETKEAVFVKAYLMDISVLGCAIDSPYLIPPGVILDLRIDATPFSAESGIEHKGRIEAIVKVTSCVMKAQGHYRLGACFTKIEKKDAALIGGFIKAKERRQAPRWDMTK